MGDQRAQDHTGRWYCITVYLILVLFVIVLLVLFVFLVLHGLLVLLVLLKEQWWITPGGGD